MSGKKDILIVCALKVETQGQLENYKTLYTGVGKVNATYELTKYLSIHIAIGELVDCTQFIQRDMDVTGLGFMKHQTPFESPNDMVIRCTTEFNPIGKNYTCGTGDSFVENIKGGDSNIDVFDMESYALAKVCYHYDIPFISFKYITDNVDEHSSRDWEDNLSGGIVEFKERVLEKL